MASKRTSSAPRRMPAAKTAAVLLGAGAVAVVVSQRRPPARPSTATPAGARVTTPAALPAPAPSVAPAHLPVHTQPVKVPPTAPRPDRRKGALLTFLALLTLGAGVGFVGVAVASQRSAPAPPREVAVQTPVVAPVPDVPAPGRPIDGWALTRRAGDTPAPQAPAASPKSAPTPLTLPASRPRMLDIPAIGVHSAVRHLGQADDGSLEVPAGKHYNDAAWYRHSPAPGSLGPAILLGHVDSAADGPSVFFRLGDVRRGNRINVTRADGSTATFVVDSVRRYAKAAFPTDVVYRDLDHAGLRIVTCGGAFDSASGHYLDNIVVFASLAGSR